MQKGYLTIETHPDHDGVIRLATRVTMPSNERGIGGGHVCYIAEFNDIDAGLMHMHEVLRRNLIDIDNHLYKASMPLAVAAIRSRQLVHREIWIDPEIENKYEEEINAQIDTYRQRQARFKLIIGLVGRIAIGLLIAQALAVLFIF